MNRFRRMLITRSDDGYFERNPELDSMSLASEPKRSKAAPPRVSAALPISFTRVILPTTSPLAAILS